MENHCMTICKNHIEIPEGSYSDDGQAYDHENPPYADDAQYFDIDIALPFSPTYTTPTSSSEDDRSEDGFQFNFSICSANPPNPNHCISVADNLFYGGQLHPLQLIPTPLEYGIDIKDIHSPLGTSSNVPLRIKTYFPMLLKTATKLKISFFGFRKSAKHGMDLQSPCAEYAGTGIAMGTPVPKKNRFFAVKLKVLGVPLVSVFSRDNSISAKRDYNNNGFQKKSEASDDGERHTSKNMDRHNKRAKEIVQKYVKKIRPFYVNISQRSNDKIRSNVEKPGVRNRPKNGGCQGSERMYKQRSFSDLSGILKMVYKHWGKGKQQASYMQQQFPNYYCSESTLMELQSAIQGAIAHCKKSNYIQ